MVVSHRQLSPFALMKMLVSSFNMKSYLDAELNDWKRCLKTPTLEINDWRLSWERLLSIIYSRNDYLLISLINITLLIRIRDVIFICAAIFFRFSSRWLEKEEKNFDNLTCRQLDTCKSYKSKIGSHSYAQNESQVQ